MNEIMFIMKVDELNLPHTPGSAYSMSLCIKHFAQLACPLTQHAQVWLIFPKPLQ